MSVPPANRTTERETFLSSDPGFTVCVHELALAIGRVLYSEDALTYVDVSADTRNDAHDIVQELTELPRCHQKG